MKRRASLALALCLTTIVGFFIVAYGTHVGDAVIAVSSQTTYNSALAPSFSFSQITPGMSLKTKVLVAGGGMPTGPNGSWTAVSVKQDVKTIGLDGAVTSAGR